MPITHTAVEACITHRPVADAGKPQIFTDEQLDVLRRLARGYREKHNLSQTAFGEKIGLGQQAASTFLNKGGGISWIPASYLARALGDDEGVDLGLDDLFKQHGVYLWASKEEDPNTIRKVTARQLVRSGDLSEETYARIRTNPKYNTPEYRAKDGMFWDVFFRGAEAQLSRAMPELASIAKAQGEVRTKQDAAKRARAKKEPPQKIAASAAVHEPVKRRKRA